MDSTTSDPLLLNALKRSSSVPHITPQSPKVIVGGGCIAQQTEFDTSATISGVAGDGTDAPNAAAAAAADNATAASNVAASLSLSSPATPVASPVNVTPTNTKSNISGTHNGRSGIFMSHTLRSQKSSPTLPSAAASISFGGQQPLSPAGSTNRCDSPTAFINSSSSANSCSSSNNTSPHHSIFGPHRTRRYSTSFSPLAASGGGSSHSGSGSGSGSGGSSAVLRLTPRVSQLRQEECADISNSREVSHERDVHNSLQITQSWEDLSLDAASSDSLSVRSGSGSASGGDGGGDLSHPLHVTTLGLLGLPNCSSPSPTNRTPIRQPPYGLSPSPTRRTFATRRSMSPIAMRPSSLGPVKRKFEMDESSHYASSPPPFKKFFQERGNSPIIGQSTGQYNHQHHNHPYSNSIYNHQTQFTCPSPDSTECGNGGGRCTPKLFMSKLCTNSSSSFSSSSSPSTTSAPSPSMEVQIDLQPLLQQQQQQHQQQQQEEHHRHENINDAEPMQTNAGEDVDDRNAMTTCLAELGAAKHCAGSTTTATTTSATDAVDAKHESDMSQVLEGGANKCVDTDDMMVSTTSMLMPTTTATTAATSSLPPPSSLSSAGGAVAAD